MQNLMLMFTFFCVRSEMSFLGKFGPKNQNCQFTLKFGTKTNFNMQNSMMVFNFAVLNWKYPFGENLVSKFKIVSLSWHLAPRLINSNMQNSMVLFTVAVLDQKYPFWANLLQKVKIASLSWNLVSRLIRICRI